MKKLILGIVIGAAAGGAAAWYLTKRKYEAIIDEEVDAAVDYFRAKEKKEKADTTQQPTAEEKPLDEPVTASQRDTSSIDGYTADYADDPVDYRKIVKELDYAVTHPEPVKPSEDNSGSKIISYEEFGEEDSYDVATVTYYEESKIVIDEQTGEEMPSGVSLIGENNIESFVKADGDVFYVRNERYGTDYEVIINHGKYVPDIEE